MAFLRELTLAQDAVWLKVRWPLLCLHVSSLGYHLPMFTANESLSR